MLKNHAQRAFRAICGVGLCCIAGLALGQVQAAVPQALTTAEILTYTNDTRGRPQDCGEQGKFEAAPALVWDERLARIANFISRDNAERNELSHLDKYGRGLLERAREFARLRTGGENLAYSPDLSAQSAASVVKEQGLFNPVPGWLDSPGHCLNLMRPTFRRMGAAYALDKKGGIYWAQIFSD